VPKRLAALISGRGRNLEALIAACRDRRIEAAFVGVISSRADAPGLRYARDAGIETRVIEPSAWPTREAFDLALDQALRGWQADIVVLAGFMRVLGDTFVTSWAGRLLNIHPSLLPRHPGLHTHRRALEAGDTEHGATVHFVTPTLDAGPGILQGRLAIGPGWNPERLSAEVLQRIELRIYPEAVGWLASGRLEWRDGAAWLDGEPLPNPRDYGEVDR
jgi:phosphoribosylglycinamide formyltransferase-1